METLLWAPASVPVPDKGVSQAPLHPPLPRVLAVSLSCGLGGTGAAGHGPHRPWGPLNWPCVPPLRTCARLSPATQTPWTQAAVAAYLFLSWTEQSVAWGRSAGSGGACASVCVCVRARACSPRPAPCSLLRGWRQQDLSKWGQRALALSERWGAQCSPHPRGRWL